MATGYGIPPPKPLQLDDGNAAENWKTSKVVWDNYELATGVAEKPEKVRVATLRAVIGEDANRVFETFVFADDGDKTKILPVLAKSQEYCEPRKNYIYNSYKFHNLSQGADRIDTFVTKLRTLARQCDFGTKENMMIRDRIVLGVRDDKQDSNRTYEGLGDGPSERGNEDPSQNNSGKRDSAFRGDTKGWKSRKESFAERETSTKATDRGLQLLRREACPKERVLSCLRQKVQ